MTTTLEQAPQAPLRGQTPHSGVMAPPSAERPQKSLEASLRAKRPRRSKGEGSVFQTTVKGVEVWRATYSVTTPEGKRKIITGTSPSKSEAIMRRDKLHRKYLVETGLADPAIPTDAETPNYTLQDWLEKWLENLNEERVQANTRQRTRGLIRNHITPHIGEKRLTAINETHINQLLKETLPAKTKPSGELLLGSSPIRGIYYILNDALTEAERQGVIRQNPLKYIEAPRKTRKTELNLTERSEDVPKIMEYLLFKDEDTAHWILSFYGLRASERLGLEWSSITNLTDNLNRPAILTIDRQLYNDAEARKLYIKRQTKTKAGTRQIPLPDEVRMVLIEHKTAQQEQKKSPKWNPKEEFKDLIYTTSTGNAIRQSKDNVRWRQFVKRVGLQELRGHDMRHLTASWLAQTGVSAEIAKTILGHNSEAMTSYYTHISLLSKSKAMNQLQGGYEAALKNLLLGTVPEEGDRQEAINDGLRRAARDLKDSEDGK